MDTRLVAVATMVIAVGGFGLIGLWVYSQIKRPKPRQTRRRDSDLVVSHRFAAPKKGRKLRPAQAAPVQYADEDSRWQRPGFTAPARANNERQPLPLYEPNAPRHVFIPRQTSMNIIPHETVGPEQAKAQPRLSQRTQRSQPTVLIKTIRVEDEEAYRPSVRPVSEDDHAWPARAKVSRMDRAI